MCRTQSQITTKEQSGAHTENRFCCFEAWTYPNALNVAMWYHGMSFSLVILIGCIIRPSTSCLRHNAGGRSTSRFDWNNHWWLPRFVWKLRIGQQNYYLTFYSSLRHLSYNEELNYNDGRKITLNKMEFQEKLKKHVLFYDCKRFLEFWISILGNIYKNQNSLSVYNYQLSNYINL